jgi:hypothetical protein
MQVEQFPTEQRNLLGAGQLSQNSDGLWGKITKEQKFDSQQGQQICLFCNIQISYGAQLVHPGLFSPEAGV